MECYTLIEFNQFVRQFVSLNVPEALWITAELGQVNNAKGHYYLELIQKDEATDQLVARSQAALWAKTYASIKASKKTPIAELLKEGLQIKIKARLDFHETFGLKLFIEDIDEAYTYGQMAIKRTEILNRLKKEQLLDLNKRLVLTAPIKKIAVISSSTAAGYQDFINHLEQNEFGYQFKVLLFSSAVQGLGIEQGFKDALEDISIYDDFDCVVIVRGGGSKIDLAGFDNYEVSKATAQCKFPVLVGIGHEVDETILDMVAFRSLKTPTAVADHIISLNLEYETYIHTLGLEIQKLSKKLIAEHLLLLNQRSMSIKNAATLSLQSQDQNLSKLMDGIKYLAQHQIELHNAKMLHLERTCELLNVSNTLKRGFSITRTEEGVIVSSKGLKEDQIIKTQLLDGSIQSKIIK